MYGELAATIAFEHLVDAGALQEEFALPFIQTVENACYLHDIGNPPFGHLGEFAVREWFRNNEEAVRGWWKAAGVKPEQGDAHFESFRHFDGNSQGFRIVSRLQWLTDQWGLNLTCPLLGAMVKYLAPRPVHGRQFGKKAGFFESERELVLSVWRELGLATEDMLPSQRHPLSFLMEAADDIAYCVSDIEDALEKGVVSPKEVADALPSGLAKHPTNALATRQSRDAPFINYRIALTRRLVEIAGKAFADRYSDIQAGRFSGSLLDADTDAQSDLDALKAFAREKIFVSKETVTIELSGYRILSTLLDRFAPLLRFSSDAFRRLLPTATRPLGYGELALERRLFSMLPGKHVLNYSWQSEADPALEPIFRTHLLVDYIAGMTDRHAVRVFRTLEGDLAGDLA